MRDRRDGRQPKVEKMLQKIGVLTVSLLVWNAGMALASGTAPTGLSLKGNQAGTVFRSLVVEGESRVRVHFDRPRLAIQVDGKSAPGLDLDSGMDILDRTLPDMVTPFLETSALVATTASARPWLDVYAGGPVATFTPRLDGVDSWKLQVVDSRGQTAMVFAGRHNPPTAIPWDGTRLDGTPAPPGYTYSYVLEARDHAGNLRRFVGDGFALPAYRRAAGAGPDFLVSGDQLKADQYRQSGAPALLLAAASGFNTRCEPTRTVRVIATCRTESQAARLAGAVAGALRPLVGGAPERVVAETDVQAGAPVGGTLRLTVATGDQSGP